MAERRVPVPRGIEVLVKKASVDPAFRALLLERRAGAAEGIGLTLAPAEAAMLGAIPAAQLDAIIARTQVDPMSRAAFLGKAAAVMLAALGASGCEEFSCTMGERADRPPVTKREQPNRPEKAPPKPRSDFPPTDGIRPDRPLTQGIQPDRP
ncbi:MAG: hypothetical protein FJ290_02590 [Planctomycetes bacterium]|nr:hypothetical protein [Planctomycetota bacterium]